MGYITYKQYDSRWGSKNYNGSSSMATAGCGPTSVAMLAYAANKNVTPWTVAKYMQNHGYAIRNNGTAWSGIPAAMKNFGLKDVSNVVAMSDIFKKLDKGYCAVFLFRAGSRGGITWTTSGHYVAVTGYKVKNGKHYLYTRDSGGRGHTGWYCYETQMRGLIPQVWCGYVPGMLKNTSKKSPDWATKACAWAKKIAADNSYHYVRYTSDKKTHECPVCHKHSKGKYHGWNCIGFAFSCWHHSGLKSKCSNDVIGDPTWNKILRAKTDAKAEKIASAAVGIPVKVIRNGGKAVPQSKLKKGDICAYFEGNSYKHTFLYIGGGKLADCTTGRKDEIKYGVAFSGNYKNKAKVVLRPRG